MHHCTLLSSAEVMSGFMLKMCKCIKMAIPDTESFALIWRNQDLLFTRHPDGQAEGISPGYSSECCCGVKQSVPHLRNPVSYHLCPVKGASQQGYKQNLVELHHSQYYQKAM